MHVIDASSPAALRQRETVQNVLTSLGVCPEEQRVKVLEVWNKADRVLLIAGRLEHLFRRQIGANAESSRRPEAVAEGAGSVDDVVGACGAEGQAGPRASEASGGGPPSQAAMQRAMQMWLALLRAAESGPRQQRDAAAAEAASAVGHGEANAGWLPGAREGGQGGAVRSGSLDGWEGTCVNSGSTEMCLDANDESLNAGVHAGVVISAAAGWGLQELRQRIQWCLVQVALRASSAQGRVQGASGRGNR